MDSSVWVGAVSGLLGTGIGGGLSIWSTVMSRRHQIVDRREMEAQARGSGAIEKAMEYLLAVWRDARRAGEEDEVAGRLLQERVLAVQILMQRVPHAGLRERVRIDTLFLPLSPPGDTRSWEVQRVDRIFLCADAIAALGAYLRGEPLPPPAERVTKMRDTWPFWEVGTDRDTFIWESEDASPSSE
ncbi:hypothetical protein POF50_017220 [Streptomyces sp. SL13]|uniref:Uncharacterized protein n=1 Tax=Streptantibioticus silvisoli TaxID=2705255 RepID=A0AA90H0J8_9ACTN|nr:hypothetical protein [Streptantibioticus silvisoli]MDI5971064.1 hypothetical protein [Streptantibioticus silvisoli]